MSGSGDLAVDQQIAAFLAVCKTASLATVDADGLAYAANIQYASDDAWRLYWVSSAASVHSRNLQARPRSAITIYAHQDLPEDIHGLQMRGNAEVLDAHEADAAYQRYAGKYPFITGPPYDQAVKMQLFYRFTPDWLRWIDNRRGFGWKVEKTF